MYIFFFSLICIFLDIYLRSLGGFILGVWTFDVVGGGEDLPWLRTLHLLLSFVTSDWLFGPILCFFLLGAMNWRFGLVLCKSYLSIFFFFFLPFLRSYSLFSHQDVLSS